MKGPQPWEPTPEEIEAEKAKIRAETRSTEYPGHGRQQ